MGLGAGRGGGGGAVARRPGGVPAGGRSARPPDCYPEARRAACLRRPLGRDGSVAIASVAAASVAVAFRASSLDGIAGGLHGAAVALWVACCGLALGLRSEE